MHKGVVNKKFPFHGTNSTPPEKIFKSRQGFDFQVVSDMWGTETYFTDDAKYSDERFAYHLTGSTKQLILAKVLTGETHSYDPESDRSHPSRSTIQER